MPPLRAIKDTGRSAIDVAEQAAKEGARAVMDYLKMNLK